MASVATYAVRRQIFMRNVRMWFALATIKCGHNTDSSAFTDGRIRKTSAADLIFTISDGLFENGVTLYHGNGRIRPYTNNMILAKVFIALTHYVLKRKNILCMFLLWWDSAIISYCERKAAERTLLKQFFLWWSNVWPNVECVVLTYAEIILMGLCSSFPAVLV